MHVYYHILDMSALSTWVLYKGMTEKVELSQRNVILQLCEEVRATYIASRRGTVFNVSQTNDIKDNIAMKRSKCKVKHVAKEIVQGTLSSNVKNQFAVNAYLRKFNILIIFKIYKV